MLSVPGPVKIFLCRQPTDMRKSFDSLAALVADILQQDPLSGHLFVFRSKRGDLVKLLYWDDDGYALWYKRLEAGTFRFPIATGDPADDAASVTLSATDLALLLGGVDLASVRRTKRYRRPVAAS
jgi:transposase